MSAGKRFSRLIAFATLVVATAAQAADVRVMISAGFHGVYSQLVPAFEKATGHHVITTRGPSMGDSPEAIPTRLGRGETADMVIMDGKAAEELAKRGLVRDDTRTELALSQVGMVVRAGAAKPDIGSVDAFRNTLLAAKSIAYSDSGSGTYLSRTLFPKLGIADQIAGKSRKVRGPPSGEPVAAVVARGEAEIGFQQVSELIHVPGVTYVGTIPAELQPGFSFAGAVTTKAQQPDAAKALIRFLASPEAAPTIVKAGLAPVPAAAITGPREAALSLVEQWASAFSRSDVDGIVRLYAPDALFIGTGSKAVVASPEGVRKYFENALLNNRPRGASLEGPQAMVVSEDTVVVTGLDTVTGVRDGQSFANGGRVTFVIAKRGPEWRIVHFHRSAMPK